MIAQETTTILQEPKAQRFRRTMLVWLGALLLLAPGQGQAAASKHSPWHIALSIPFPCVCRQLDVGYAPSQNTLVGIHAYHGMGFLLSTTEARQTAGFFRFYPISGSFYFQLTAGQMTTTYEFLDTRDDDSGAYGGVAVGNLWRVGDNFSHGIVWYGEDHYFKRSDVTPLPHLLRYQLGLRF